jgi:hypothetical protein
MTTYMPYGIGAAEGCSQVLWSVLLGSLRRRVEVSSRTDRPGTGEARGAVEDDFHHFKVTVRAKDGVVTEVTAEAPRHPNTLCPTAGERLTDLVGMRLSEVSTAVMERTDARQQCTHQIDLAGLAIAALTRGIERRVYELEVPDRTEARTHVRLWRDGAPLLEWDVEGAVITGPAPFAGLDIGSGFTGWARRNLDLDAAEAALVLRRGVFISSGRTVDLDDPERRTGPMGGCWVWQPGRAELAKRVLGSTHDFTDRPQVLTRDDQAWLGFSEEA